MDLLFCRAINNSRWSRPDRTEPVCTSFNSSNQAWWCCVTVATVRSGQMTPGPTNYRTGGQTKTLIGPRTVEPRPPVVSPKPPIGCPYHPSHLKKKKSLTEQTLLPLVTTASGREGGRGFIFFSSSPIGQFQKHANCQSLSGQSGYSTHGTFWNCETTKK